MLILFVRKDVDGVLAVEEARHQQASAPANCSRRGVAVNTTGRNVMLAGWYLIVAPKHQSGLWSRYFGMQFADTNAPLSQWSIIGVFETARECESAKRALLSGLRDSERVCAASAATTRD